MDWMMAIDLLACLPIGLYPIAVGAAACGKSWDWIVALAAFLGYVVFALLAIALELKIPTVWLGLSSHLACVALCIGGGRWYSRRRLRAGCHAGAGPAI